MFTKILLPTDGSDAAEQAARQGVELAKSVGAQVIGVCILAESHSERGHQELARSTASGYTVSGEPSPQPPPLAENADEDNDRAAAISERYLAGIRSAAEDAGVQCRCVYRISDDVAEALVNIANEQRCDLIIMASHGLGGFKRLVVGSQTYKVLTHSSVPVLVWR